MTLQVVNAGLNRPMKSEYQSLKMTRNNLDNLLCSPSSSLAHFVLSIPISVHLHLIKMITGLRASSSVLRQAAVKTSQVSGKESARGVEWSKEPYDWILRIDLGDRR
jgi:hypothetical protein